VIFLNDTENKLSILASGVTPWVQKVQGSEVQRLDNNRNRSDMMLKTSGQHPKARTLESMNPEPWNHDKRTRDQMQFQGNSRGSSFGQPVLEDGHEDEILFSSSYPYSFSYSATNP
jgi:hypothetical protein